jgi:hypothetical protein
MELKPLPQLFLTPRRLGSSRQAFASQPTQPQSKTKQEANNQTKKPKQQSKQARLLLAN